MTALKTAKGQLTPYGLSCGYIEQFNTKDAQVSLWGEPTYYCVRAHNFTTGKRLFWETYTTLTAARKHYAKTLKMLRSYDD